MAAPPEGSPPLSLEAEVDSLAPTTAPGTGAGEVDSFATDPGRLYVRTSVGRAERPPDPVSHGPVDPAHALRAAVQQRFGVPAAQIRGRTPAMSGCSAPSGSDGYHDLTAG